MCCVEVLKRPNCAHGEQDIVDSGLFKEQPNQSADTGLYRTSFHLYRSHITRDKSDHKLFERH